jgi:DNA-binding MarR family transcriptional regulator
MKRDVSTPRARRTDPITSWVAAASVSDKARAGEKAALHALWLHDNDGGLTDHEIAAVTGWIATSVGVRRKSLERQGLVQSTPARRMSPSQRPCIVWSLTEAGRTAVYRYSAVSA